LGGWWIGGTVALVVIAGIAAALALGRPTLRETAVQAEAAGHWQAALDAWRAINQSNHADGRSLLGEASAALALGRAGQAERALERTSREAPSHPEPWLLWLELLRLEDRPLDARRVGEAALAAVPPESKREVLKALTLALLADAPDDLARETLKRWIAADPTDLDARAALLRRVAGDPRPDDPSARDRAAEAAELLAGSPDHLSIREALVLALAEAGDPDRGRAVLDSWPKTQHDARYHRLRGRWHLIYDHPRDPKAAAESFRRALTPLPFDWRTHYGLTRALSASGLKAEAAREVEIVSRLHEILDPTPLGRRIDADLAHLDSPSSRVDLADLCERVGLVDLAAAWRLDASAPVNSSLPSGFTPLLPPSAKPRPGR
jgi:thioredoxin-like negative regulator of GroEL